MVKASNFVVRSPLQVITILGIEGVLTAAIFAVEEGWLQTLLVIVIVFIAVCFVATSVYVVIYLLHKRPHLLFNPSDYAPEVQPLLFSNIGMETTKAPEQITGIAEEVEVELKSDFPKV